MKERLTGAIIVVAALVLLVPELLTGPSPKTGAQPASAESGPMRSYTIDLADDAAGGPSSAAPTSVAPTTVAEDPVAMVKAGQGDESAAGTDEGAVEPAPGTERPSNDVSGAGADTGSRGAGSSGSRSGGSASGAQTPNDASSASPQSKAPVAGASSVATPGLTTSGVATPGASTSGVSTSGNRTATSGKPGSSEGTEPEQPRSAFGPNAARPAAASSSSSAARREVATASVPSARQGGDRRGETPPRSEPAASKGWAVQLGVFASRENAERLAKQVKGKGYPVVVNETSGTKHLYRVRVGPEKDRAAADALKARLRAAGHGGTVVAVP